MTRVREQVKTNLEIMRAIEDGSDPRAMIDDMMLCLYHSTIVLAAIDDMIVEETKSEAKRDTKRQVVQTGKTKRTRKRNEGK